MEEILRLFPKEFATAIKEKVSTRWESLEEIRVRLNQPIELIFNNVVEWIFHLVPNDELGIYVLNQLSEFSLYRLENELREGFITIEGGHRVGIAGKVNTKNGFVKAIQHISFFNIRVAKQQLGVAKKIIPHLYNKHYLNTLVIGPPQSGKTTMIRDISRLISNGWGKQMPEKVGIVDERSEIAASIEGVPQHQVGIRTDVMDACPKAEGMMMMIRSMSPEVLIVDEIGTNADMEALLEAVRSGVTIICSIHGENLTDLQKRPYLNHVFATNVFERFIILERNLYTKQSIDLRNKLGKQIMLS